MNIKNIMLVNDPSETMGMFWYIMVEMFQDRLVFLKYAFLLMQLSCCLFISIMIKETADMMDRVAEG